MSRLKFLIDMLTRSQRPPTCRACIERLIDVDIFVCYECRAGNCADCIGVPCMCDCPGLGSMEERVESPRWETDEELGERVPGIYPLWEQKDPNAPLQRLPITFSGRTMKELRESVRQIARDGCQCWPGEIKPLARGQSYGVYLHDTEESTAGVWLAVIGRAKA